MHPKPHAYLATELTLEALRLLEEERDAHHAARAALERLRRTQRSLMAYCAVYCSVLTIAAIWGWMR